ncbi:MAG: hypothetical protein PWQ31_30 [Eubacteriales bacterium]|nr:hypothetical protein [Eubacteriales bacterium]
MSVNKVEGHFSPGMIWHRLVGGCTSLFFFFFVGGIRVDVCFTGCSSFLRS